jgi:hypothetical protein
MPEEPPPWLAFLLGVFASFLAGTLLYMITQKKE